MSTQYQISTHYISHYSAPAEIQVPIGSRFLDVIVERHGYSGQPIDITGSMEHAPDDSTKFSLVMGPDRKPDPSVYVVVLEPIGSPTEPVNIWVQVSNMPLPALNLSYIGEISIDTESKYVFVEVSEEEIAAR